MDLGLLFGYLVWKWLNQSLITVADLIQVPYNSCRPHKYPYRQGSGASPLVVTRLCTYTWSNAY